ncbi:MAG: S41 family peptidase [Clostridiales bacterium]|nr:S41 family peptidase [Clostridiales bacterium]
MNIEEFELEDQRNTGELSEPKVEPGQETGTSDRGKEEQETGEDPKKRRSRRGCSCLGRIFIYVLVALIGFIGGQLFLLRLSSGAGINNLKVMQKLLLMEAYVSNYFLNDIDSDALEESIYAGFMDGLDDDYAAYYTKEEYEQLTEDDSGEYWGIGVTVREDADTGYAVIEAVNRGDPAYNAGVQVDDMIIAVDGVDTSGLTLQETVNAIRENEEPVVLTILRDGETMDITVEKAEIEAESVEWVMKEDQIGYISVSQFIENTADQFDEAVTDLTEQGMTSLIIDLRDNGGGLLTTCLSMVSRIIPEGDLIVYTENKNGNRTEYNSDSDAEVTIPMVVLVNENSASASEIMTGCLKDYGVATIVGETTYGKGIVQNIIPLSDGSAIKMTASKYYTPDGNNIHGVGIEPDITVEMDDEEWAAALEDEEQDTQLIKAYEVLTQ